MAYYYLSDVHLRLDRPDRGERLARLVDRLTPHDRLTIAGDLCDFWFASRQRGDDPMSCAGLRALARFRERGGDLTILPGNHDTWLGPFYEQSLGARFVQEPIDEVTEGVRVHLVHGHLLGARSSWKAVLESRTFLQAFGTLPRPIARRLASRLDASNEVRIAETHRRHLIVYREYARELADAGRADLILFGHVHEIFDEPAGNARLIVIGHWTEGGASFVRIDDGVITFEREGQ